MKRPPRSLLASAMAFCLALALCAGPARSGRAGASSERARGERATAALSVLQGRSWREWWSAQQSPDAPARDTVLASAARFRAASPGVEWAELELAGRRGAWRTRLVVARLDPARLAMRLALETEAGSAARWTVARARADERIVFAVNAGQFAHTLPWGWVVLDGRERFASGTGPLASACMISREGIVRWRHGGAGGAGAADAQSAFQSYPTLLVDGASPAALSRPGAGLDLKHRDARAALGTLADGRVIVALTRFDALGPALGALPFGLTTPEMAAVMASLGARDAVMLDGGLSAQMLVRDSTGAARAWPGLRAVPLALVATVR